MREPASKADKHRSAKVLHVARQAAGIASASLHARGERPPAQSESAAVGRTVEALARDDRSVSSRSILQLQQQFGNRHVQRLIAARGRDEGVDAGAVSQTGAPRGGAVAARVGRDAAIDPVTRGPGPIEAAPSAGTAPRSLQRQCAACASEGGVSDTEVHAGASVASRGDAATREADRSDDAATRAPASGVATSRNPFGGGAGDEVTTAGFWEDVGIGAGLGALVGGVTGAAIGAGVGALVGSTGSDGGAGGGCTLKSGPSYSPSGTIPVTNAGGRKTAPFSFAAAFDSAGGAKPSCCEVHQFIKWDSAFEKWRGGPPHSGFGSGASAGTWYEDRDTANKRYGHRAGAYSDPIAGCGDEYKTGAVQDQANGDLYCGRDAPGGPDTMTGQFQFRLDAVDTCNGNSVKASSGVITINW